MKCKSYPISFIRVFRGLFLIIFLFLLLATVQPGQTQNIPQDPEIIQVSPYYSYFETTLSDGTPITANIINGPPKPPLGKIPETFPPIPKDTITGIIPNFPSYRWVFGCSAVSGAMISAYYDRGAYTNIYTGATGGGIYPLTDTGFGTWTDGVGDTYPNNPLVGSKQGVDGLTVKGSINDYWVSYGSPAADPYITGGWTEHTIKTSIGDWMGTSQSAKLNTDGSTAFYNYQTSASPLTCDLVAGLTPPDGNLGRREFYASRGYSSTDCYNQVTDNTLAGGFSFINYKAEINAGHPVLIHLEGHSIVGYGYADPNIVYIRDTWSSNTVENRSMTWGGSYDGMAMHSVSILHLQSLTLLPPTNISLSATSIAENKPVNTAIGTFSSTDPNPGDTFSYSLVAGTGDTGNSSFNISGNTLRNSSIFNYEAQNSYSIRVRVTDQGSLTFEKAFTITVTNVNEAPTNITLSASTIAENAAINTTIGTFGATDPDTGNTFSYSLVAGTGDTGNSSFNISGNTLRNSSVFNYEAQNSYSIRVRVTDQGSLTFEKAFAITVTNVNEAPVNLSLSISMIVEGKPSDTEVGLLSSQDPDSGDLFTYSLVEGDGGDDNAQFTISGNSLRTAAIFDYPTHQMLHIRVRTIDQGGLFYETAFVIIVVEVINYLFLPLITK